MPERHPQPGDGWEDLLNQACNPAYNEANSVHSARRALSILSESEREELDLHLSRNLSEEESEVMHDCLAQLEDLIQDRPKALELLEHVRQDIARTALRCIEQSYRYGKRRGQREALDMLLPYIQETSPAA
jgi:transposase